ncbi:Vi polysaccharide biosynthesis protein VipA/TviB [Pelobium manganitolerans]|uniref:Vi polysaccharide biosynthesis protein VipA/TviB n=1 Tax=Pelobium manganitolerans TaxID=1842495 RepID=A0A419S2J1_9SPHI|nr:nucleotide sugar dehydrogenase [Pelobium manganitolerans]RKD13190.1 Vi polysaccharide biosynthesis protein VipA/TviB [Pelobium manganitolerans]
MNLSDAKIAVIGLGYVGLPLALEFSKKYPVIGFDVNKERVSQLKQGIDTTLEANESELRNATNLKFTNDAQLLGNCNIYIVSVPTPVDKFNSPDISLLQKASATVAKALKKGDIVIYESTVYPGCTEEDCVPILEKESGLKFNVDFTCGYSPERINPGDKINTLTSILKLTSGSTPQAAQFIDALYGSIIKAGTYLAQSIKVAEAAKVIENSQRDVNIAFVNELALIFNRLNIDTQHVLDAAATKWNFLKYKPGLVGGHCIGVDPYYLAQKAESVGYRPSILLAGRRINDAMSEFIADEVLKGVIDSDVKVKGSKVLILGVTFKENCTDVRNTKIVDIYNKLKAFGLDVTVVDPWASAQQVKHEYDIDLHQLADVENTQFDAIVHAVAHQEFQNLDFKPMMHANTFVYDVKATLPPNLVSKRL